MKHDESYTQQMIADRLEEAARTMRRLPAVKVQGYAAYWPEMLYSERERYQMENKSQRCLPTPEKIERMEEACNWLRFLINIEDRRLLWLRAERASWKYICAKFGIKRSAANERWKNGLEMISLNLTRTHSNTFKHI